MIKIFLTAITILYSSILFAQNDALNKNHSIVLKTQFVQYEDSFNYGLVFSGLNIAGGYSFTKLSDKNTLLYTPELALGANSNKGVGVAIKLKPIDVFYGYHIKNNLFNALTVGGYFSANYQWQLYPELQSGHMFWFTSIELGPQLMLTLPYKNKLINITFSNSIAGWTSRPEPSTETYFYSLKISDFIKNAHSNLNFGSLNIFNHTNFEIGLLNIKVKRLSFTYKFEYFGYYQNPKLSYINHSLNFKWKIGKL